MKALELVDLLLEADRLSAGPESGVYIFGPNLPEQGLAAPSVEQAMADFRQRGVIPAQGQGGAALLDQLVGQGYTFFVKTPGNLEVIGPVPAQTTPEGQKHAAAVLGLDQLDTVAYRRTATATPTTIAPDQLFFGTKKLEPQQGKPQSAKDEFVDIKSPVTFGMTFDLNSKRGIRVLEVIPGGPAAQAGIQAGDVITQTGKFLSQGRRVGPYFVRNERHLTNVLNLLDPRYLVSFKVVRGDVTRWIPVKLEPKGQLSPAERPESTAPQTPAPLT